MVFKPLAALLHWSTGIFVLTCTRGERTAVPSFTLECIARSGRDYQVLLLNFPPHLVLVDSDASDVRACELGNVAVWPADTAAAVQNLSAGVNAQPTAKVILVPLEG